VHPTIRTHHNRLGGVYYGHRFSVLISRLPLAGTRYLRVVCVRRDAARSEIYNRRRRRTYVRTYANVLYAHARTHIPYDDETTARRSREMPLNGARTHTRTDGIGRRRGQ